ncbi:MAG: MGMT family protein [Acidobacteria bacterium]|nr:MGMT family protein [Acidobacteriota bacterium]
MKPFFTRAWELVRQVPRGRVVTYGQVAHALGEPRGARTVGWALRAAPEGLPWHRVINADGRISPAGRDPGDLDLQRALLESEGVRFGPDGRVDLRHYRWPGPGPLPG